MTKEQILEVIKLLSAVESWSFLNGNSMPPYLHDKLDKSVDVMTKELLK